MRKILLYTAVFAAIVALQYGPAYGFAKGEQDCTKCHTINPDQAKDVIKDLIPDVKVLEILPGPFQGIWEVGIETGGRKLIVYIDYSRKKIIAGNIFDSAKRANLTKESFDRLNKVDVAVIPYDKALLLGSKDAKFKVAVFDDPD